MLLVLFSFLSEKDGDVGFYHRLLVVKNVNSAANIILRDIREDSIGVSDISSCFDVFNRLLSVNMVADPKLDVVYEVPHISHTPSPFVRCKSRATCTPPGTPGCGCMVDSIVAMLNRAKDSQIPNIDDEQVPSCAAEEFVCADVAMHRSFNETETIVFHKAGHDAHDEHDVHGERNTHGTVMLDEIIATQKRESFKLLGRVPFGNPSGVKFPAPKWSNASWCDIQTKQNMLGALSEIEPKSRHSGHAAYLSKQIQSFSICGDVVRCEIVDSSWCRMYENILLEVGNGDKQLCDDSAEWYRRQCVDSCSQNYVQLVAMNKLKNIVQGLVDI